MTINKPNVQRYGDMGCPEQICRVDTMHEMDDGDYVLYEDYESLQAECERLREALERIMTWPDGGNRYGQANIKVFAAEALTKYQPCGCVICTCEHETQCQGCGAKHCGTHPVGQIPGPVYQQPAPDVSELVEALERVMYCNEVAFLPESIQQAVSAALAAHRKQGGES